MVACLSLLLSLMLSTNGTRLAPLDLVLLVDDMEVVPESSDSDDSWDFMVVMVATLLSDLAFLLSSPDLDWSSGGCSVDLNWSSRSCGLGDASSSPSGGILGFISTGGGLGCVPTLESMTKIVEHPVHTLK